MNEEQIKYWNGPSAKRWIDHQAALDRTLRVFGDALLERAAAQPGERVLDVGCGCGDSLLALSGRVGPGGSVTGVDISSAMLARARELTAALPNVQVIERDAAQLPPEVHYDLIFSRFGVMFFEDPALAFTRLRATLRPGGRLVFVCWRDYSDNPWLSEPADVVRTLVPDSPPPPRPRVPGPFAFAERAHVEAILSAAGFRAVSLERFDAPIALSSGDVAEAVLFAMKSGPVAVMLANADASTLERVRSALTAKLHAQRSEAGIVLGSSTWLVSAQG